MGKLILKLDDLVVAEYPLKQGDMRIGRRADNDIVIDNLAVSGVHANVFTVGEDSFIDDLNSTNGTFINSRRINKHHLRHGDAIVIGKHTLTYVADDSTQPAEEADLQKTIVLDTPLPLAATPPAAKAPTAHTKPNAALFMLSGANSGKRIDLTKTVTNLGKTGKPAGTITRRDGAFILASTDSKEVLKLNGKPVRGQEPLRHGDIIQVSDARLQFYLK